MEYQDFELITGLKVRNMCCEAYEEKLQKELLKHEGVYSVEMNREKGLVLVRGRVDPTSLVNTVARTGKHAEIVCSNTNNSSRHSKHCSSCHQESYTHPDHHQQGQHRCEDYVPQSVDDYSRSHSWRPPMYHQPESAPFFSPYGGLGTPFGNPPLRFPPPPPPPGYGFRPRGYYGYGRRGY